VLALIAGLGAAYAEPSAADDPDPRDVPSIAQYVEMVPTSKGSHRLRRDSHRSRLAPEIRRRIRSRGGADAAALEEIVSSAGMGAPKSDGASKPPRSQGASGRAPNNALAAPAADVAEDSDGTTLPLAGLLALLTAGATGFAVIRWKRGQPGS
jgi:hypothetical protein